MNIKVKGLKLEWKVLNCNYNDKKVEFFDVIRQDLIDKIVEKYRKKELKNIDELKEIIKGWAFYHYGSRCEYEIIVEDLFDRCSEKIDVYTQIMMNIDRFAEYIAREMRLFL